MDQPDAKRIRRFNQTCKWFALAWLLALIFVSQLLRPTYQDLSGIYIGGLVAKLGQWDALYPVPDPNSPFYVGAAGNEKPQMVRLADQYHVQQLTPYLQPPWQAVLFAPMGFLSFQGAHWWWLLVLTYAAWGISIQAGEILARCENRPTRLSGVVTLLVATSLLTYRSIRVQNMSPVMACFIGIICFNLTQPESPGNVIASSFAAVVGAVMKMATVILLPIAVAMRRWRLIAVSALLGIAFGLLTLKLAGRETFHEFFSRIAPTLGRSGTAPGNKSLQAMLIRLHGERPLEGTALTIFRGVQWGLLLGTLLLILMPKRLGKGYWTPPYVFAACAALLSWLLIFSPLCWEHYFIYLCPLWGWLVWEARQGPGLRSAAAIGAIAIHWATLPPVWHGKSLPEPLNSYTLLSMIVIFVMALVRLRDRRGDEASIRTPPPAAPAAASAAG